MKTKILLYLLISTATTYSQSFIPAFDRFSSKEVAYINLEDGTKVEGTIDDIDRKKGLIEEITIQVKGEKKKRKILPKDIKDMYLPASGWNKFSSALDQATDAQKWKDNDVNTEIINKGYGYFEKVNVQINNEVEPMLIQLLNPAFSSKIKVFHDPKAKESLAFGYGGVTMAGGDDQSYYIQVGNGVAKRLKRNAYNEEYLILYKDCPELLKKLKDDHRWVKLDEHLFAYTTTCK